MHTLDSDIPAMVTARQKRNKSFIIVFVYSWNGNGCLVFLIHMKLIL